MYILTYIDYSDYYASSINLAVSQDKEDLEVFLEKYPAIRDAYFSYVGRLNAGFIKQNEQLFSLRPFVLNYTKPFWPFVIKGNDLYNRMYRLTAKQGKIVSSLTEAYKNEIGFPVVYFSSDEEFKIISIFDATPAPF